jgi:SAM-dependent methyltransferase
VDAELNHCDLSQIIDVDSHRVRLESDDYAIERLYEGSYADLSNDEEINILHAIKDRPWKEVIKNMLAANSPWLYQIITDPGRSLILDVLDVPQGGIFLDVGSGWGQLSLPLSRMGQVISMDLTENRLSILREIARQEQTKLFYVQGNFLTFPFKPNMFDLIIFNGSFEWIGLGRKRGENIRDVQIKALQKARTLLKPGGLIYIGIENSMGLKYLFGAPDDHTGLSFMTFLPEEQAEKKYESLNPSKQLPAKTWSLAEYRELMNEVELEEQCIYGCFPDYKIIRHIIDIREVNDRLLSLGKPTTEHKGTDGCPFGYENEMDALYRLLARNGIAQYFCPSYGIIMRKRK